MSKPRGDKSPVSSVQTDFARALGLHRSGELAAAERAYRAILKSQHRHFDAAHLLGLIFLKRGEAEAAQSQIARALKFAAAGNPNLAEAHNNRGLALVALRRFEEALASFDHAIAAAPGHIEAFANRGGALYELGRAGEALEACDRALALEPRFAPAHNNRGKSLRDLRRFEEALASFDRAIALKPDFHDAFHNRALTHLLLGDYAKGWQDAEHRLLTAEFAGAGQLAAGVTRSELAGKRVLVIAEQGIGDEIMFAGMIPDLVRDAKSVTLECDPRLSGLFTRSFAGVTLVDRQVPAKYRAGDFDCLLAAGSLGRLYRNGAKDFPQRHSYLVADGQIAAQWKDRLAGPGLKIGISWRGGTERTRRGARSIPLKFWTPWLEGATFVSLQYGEVTEEIAHVNRSLARPILHFPASQIEDFDQLAGLVCALDLVVTVQTGLVHLCGAIGKPCRVLVPYIPEWRYGIRDERMPWYGAVKLYRQAGPGGWGETMDRAMSDLKIAPAPSDAG